MRSKCILPLMNYWKPIFRIEKKMFLFHLPNFFLNQYIYYLSPLLFSRMKNIWSKVFPKLYSQKCKHTHGMFTFPFQISTTVYLSNTRLLQVHKKGGGLLQILQKKCTTSDVWWSHFSEVIFSPQLNIGPIIHMYIIHHVSDLKLIIRWLICIWILKLKKKIQWQEKKIAILQWFQKGWKGQYRAAAKKNTYCCA